MASEPTGARPDRPIGHDLAVVDLIRAAETPKAGGEAAAAEALYSGWVATHPDDPLLYAVLFNFSVVLTDGGDVDGARRCLERLGDVVEAVDRERTIDRALAE